MTIKIEFSNGNYEYFKCIDDAINYLENKREFEEDEGDDDVDDEDTEYFEPIKYPEVFRDSYTGKYKSPYSLSENTKTYSIKYIEEVTEQLIKHGYEKTYQGKFGSTWERK